MKKVKEILPALRDWRTTDEDERNRRKIRAREEKFTIRNMRKDRPVFSNFLVNSKSGMTYSVEIRSLKEQSHSCTCTDFRKNGLGTCKHVEAVLLLLKNSFPRIYNRELQSGSGLIDIVVDPENDTLRIENGISKAPQSVCSLFDSKGLLKKDADPQEAHEKLRQIARDDLRLSQDIEPWLRRRRILEERRNLRREYEQKVHNGEYPQNETAVPLYPYQRQGMLHLAFTERALLADEMGLGKTIQAIAACALLNRLGTAKKVLVVTPASLKTEWEEQIGRFTSLPLHIVYGMKKLRLTAYSKSPFFTIVNYEQVRSDALEINARLKPDIVVLDEAQRIKNWNTGTAQAVKRLRSRYAFVLTGTPVENRIDELYSIIEFLDPNVFGPLFKFNRDFYILDDKGRPAEYKNLDMLHERIGSVMLRRRKADVESELPGRNDSNRFVKMNLAQMDLYGAHEKAVASLLSILKRRPFTPQEQEKLMRELAMMRMVCDSVYILDQSDSSSPKVDELESILDEALTEPDIKVVLFSEWVRMLELVKKLCERKKIGYAWHTGTVPQRRRRAEINLFKDDPACRIFLSSESGGVGLNLQNASVVINCDLPWNPARLEQRIARVWRKHQKRPVDVINLVSENTIEHKMLSTLAAKQGLADGVLDRIGDFSKISLKSGAQAFFKRLEQVMTAPVTPSGPAAGSKAIPADRSAYFAIVLKEKLGKRLFACEEHFPLEGSHSTIVVVIDGDSRQEQNTIGSMHEELFGKGKIDPLAPVKLETIDRSTFDALKRLEEQGLIKRTERAVRILPTEESKAGLSEEERTLVQSIRKMGIRKVTAARALHGAGLMEEAREAAIEAAFHFCKAVSIEKRIPQPDSIKQVLDQPWAGVWNGHAEKIKELLDHPDTPVSPFLETIQEFMPKFQEA